MSGPAAGAPRGSWAWLVLVAVAVAIGAAAAFLTASARARPTPAGGPTQLVGISVTTAGWIALVAFVLLFGYLLVGRLLAGGFEVDRKVLLLPLTVVLLLVVVVVVLRAVGGGAIPPLTPVAAGANNTTGMHLPNSTASSVNGSGGTLVLFGFSLPPWSLLALAATAGIVAAVVAVRLALRWSGARPAPPLRPSELGTIFARAERELAAGGDPRTALIRLYEALLARLEPYAAGLEVETAQEIQVQHLVRLGVSGPTANEITGLFELARYSSHPIGPAEVGRARAAVRSAVHELDRREGWHR